MSCNGDRTLAQEVFAMRNLITAEARLLGAHRAACLPADEHGEAAAHSDSLSIVNRPSA